ANQSNNTLEVVDVKDHQLLKQVPGQNTMHGVVYAPGPDRVFVGNGDGVCNVLDGKEYRLITSLPVKGADSVRFDPRTKHVFVTAENGLAVINAESLNLVTMIKLPGSPHGLQVASKRPKVFVNTGPSSRVAIIDTDKNEVVGQFPLDEASRGIAPLA